MRCKNASLGLIKRPRFGAVGLYLAVVGLALAGWLAGGPTHEEAGLHQDRLDTAAPPLTVGRSLGQTFLAEHPGLAWIEIYLVRYEGEAYTQSAEGVLYLTLEREDGLGDPVRSAQAISGLRHNQKLRFAFRPQGDSQGVRYRFALCCDVDAGLSAWYTQSEAYAEGHLLLDGEPQEGDLYFYVGYRYGLREVLRALWRQARRWWPAAAAVLLVWVLPGWGVLVLLCSDGQADLWERLGLVAALSACVWALAFLWARVVGLRLSATTGALLAVGCAAAGVVGRARGSVAGALSDERSDGPWPDVVMAVVMLLTVTTRLLHVRRLVLPAWVDSPHHVLMTQLLLEQGMLPRSAAPYLPVSELHYHFGFHATAAPMAWFAGISAADAVLLAGQCWQMLAPLGAYTLARRLLQERWDAVIAAGLVSTWLYMPAYYTTWGRYPHLVGLTVLCFAAGRVPELLCGRRVSRRSVALTALLSAGLGLAHFRILVLYVLWWVVCLVAVAWERRQEGDALRALASRSAVATLLVVALTLPWVIFVAGRVLPSVEATYGGWVAQDGDNAFPWRFFAGLPTRVLLVMAAVGMLWGAVRRRREILWLTVWAALATLVSLPQLVGLAPSWLMSSSALAISFWLPVSVLGGYVLADVVATLRAVVVGRRGALAWRVAGAPVLAAGLTVLIGWGAWRMVDVVNPTTILVDGRDMAAMAWIRAEMPPSARFLVNARGWIPGIYVGSDGGWWIPYLTGRQVTQPPILYYQASRAYRESVAEIAEQMARWESAGDEFGAWLRELGVTHVYVGSRGGALTPGLLDPCPALEAVYVSGPVRIYRVLPAS